MKNLMMQSTFAILVFGCSHSAGIVEDDLSSHGHEITMHSHEPDLKEGSLLEVSVHQCQTSAGERNLGSAAKCKSIRKGCAQVLEVRGIDSYFVHLDHEIEYTPALEFSLDRTGDCGR